MEKKIFTPEFYKRLYTSICEQADALYTDPLGSYQSGGGTAKFDLEIETDDMIVYVAATFEETYCDTSFSHAFGTEHSGYNELGELIDIDIDVIYDSEDNVITDFFDYSEFWEQFKAEETERRGVTIKKGDNVVVALRWGRWEQMTYLGTDTRWNRHTCIDKNGRKVDVEHTNLYPATPTYLLRVSE